ncbi:hypothetical protein OKW37_003602 [Paraburkholderia sp. MM5482-R2]
MNCATMLAWRCVSRASGASVHCASATRYRQHTESDANRAPAGKTEHPRERRTDHHAAETADRHYKPVHQWQTRHRKMLRERLERGAETHRHANADQQPPDHHHAETVRGAEYPDAERGKKQRDGRHATRAEVIEQHASGDLRARETEEIQTRQHTQIGG